MDPNQLLVHFSEQQVAAFFLVLARVSPLFILAPLFSSKMVNARVRGIVAVALTVGLMPVVKHGEIDLDVLGYAGLLVKEVIVGLAFAYALHAMFAALQVAGTLLDTLIGFSFGAMVDPITGNQGTVLSQTYALMGVMVFIAINGDAMLIAGFAKTFELVPLLDAPALNAALDGAIKAFAGIFAAAIQICAPVLLALLLTDIAFGLVTKVVPQLNVCSMGLPTKVIVGLVVMGASLPFVAGYVSDELQTSVETALSSLGVS